MPPPLLRGGTAQVGIAGDGCLVLTNNAQRDSGCPRIYPLAVNPRSWEGTGVLRAFRLRLRGDRFDLEIIDP